MNSTSLKIVIGLVSLAVAAGVGRVVLRPQATAPSAPEQPSLMQPIAKPASRHPTTAEAINAERARINIAAAEELERILNESQKPSTGDH